MRSLLYIMNALAMKTIFQPKNRAESRTIGPEVIFEHEEVQNEDSAPIPTRKSDANLYASFIGENEEIHHEDIGFVNIQPTKPEDLNDNNDIPNQTTLEALETNLNRRSLKILL